MLAGQIDLTFKDVLELSSISGDGKFSLLCSLVDFQSMVPRPCCFWPVMAGVRGKGEEGRAGSGEEQAAHLIAAGKQRERKEGPSPQYPIPGVTSHLAAPLPNSTTGCRPCL
jgi:hypothetical protein